MAVSYRARICDFFLIHLLICVVSRHEVVSDRTSLKIYQSLQADYFCFKRLNGTHEFGCSSDRTGNVGVVHVVSSVADVQYITNAESSMKYIAVLHMNFFNMGNMTLLQDSGHVTGVIVIRNRVLPAQGFSPDQSCPNRNMGMYAEDQDYASCATGNWNPQNPALSMFFVHWHFPIFMLDNETSIDFIVNKCYDKFNRHHATNKPLCAAQLKSRMSAAKDSVTCLRRSNIASTLHPVRYCDPLSGRNVISTLYPTYNNMTVDNRSVIIVGSRMDTFSIFDNIAPGADSSVTGFVTLLSVAQLLKLMNGNSGPVPQKNVLFAIFNGEAFDYIGSSRMVYDMEKGQFPALPVMSGLAPATLGLHHISHFVEIGQVAPYKPDVYLHADPLSTKDAKVKASVSQLVQDLKEAALKDWAKLILHDASDTLALPPSSVQRFLKKDKSIPAIYISNHNGSFENRYYNSMFDTAENLNSTGTTLDDVAEHLTRLAAVIASTVHKMLTGKEPAEVPQDKLRVKELLECYVVNASCALFHEVLDRDATRPLKSNPLSLYISVDPTGSMIHPAARLTKLVLSYFTGTVVENVARSNCSSHAALDKVFQFDWMDGPEGNSSGLCIKSSTMFTLAKSPAFETDDVTSKEYSTWTESVWEEASLQIFVMPSWRQEVTTMSLGVIIFLVSLALVHVVNSEAAILFTPRALVGV
uniref:Nicastrin n=1 Tax=Ornithodoros turicata TaxID=34597 RepID=A0A2R5LKX3_9ACAR